MLYEGRIVVPEGLRGDVLGALHRAHQGSTGMTLRATKTVWWLGLSVDIRKIRDLCRVCARNAPSQRPMPPTELSQPDYPFQKVAADYFFHAGHTYLVVVDRYSGWPCVSRCREESSAELIQLLRLLFCAHGVPEELATDGATVFTSMQTQKFLEVWGCPTVLVQHTSPTAI